jgi:hypothetical protein
MRDYFRRLRKRLRRRFAFITDSLPKLHTTFKSQGQPFGSQRMCPFCGLITSRYKTCCLECGRSLKAA